MSRRPASARWALLALIALFALLPAAAAQAAPTWLGASTVSPNSKIYAYPSDLTVLPDGTVVAAWNRYDDTCCTQHVEVSVRTPGGTFSAPQQLSGAGDASGVKLAQAADGEVTAVWSESVAGSYVIRSAVRPASGGAFGTFQTISGSGANAFGPAIAVGGGIAVAAWYRNGIEQAAVRPANTTFFQSANDLSASGVSGNSAVAVDGSGNAVVAYQRYNGANYVIQANARPAGGAFAALADVYTNNIAAGDDLHDPHLAMDSQGRTTIAFASYDGSVSRHKIRSGVRGTSGNFGALQVVSNPAVDSGSGGYMDLAVSSDNTAILVWSGGVTQAAVRPSGGSFGAITDISGPGTFSGNPAVRFDGAGVAVAVWQGNSGGLTAIQSASRPKGGTFGDVTDIAVSNSTDSVFGPTSLGIDPSGNAAALWAEYDDLDNVAGGTDQVYHVRAAGYDGAPPNFGAISVPGTGTAESAVDMSAPASDVWSAFNTTWDFGDGGSGTGTSLQHTWNTQGTYTVTVKATDAVGNQSTQTRTIQIGPKPIVQPPVTDADKDGVPVPQDCNDNNPGIHPGATDVPGNGVDEDCANGDATVVLSVGFTNHWTYFINKKFTKVVDLIVKRAPAGSTVTLKCKGKSCPRKSKKVVLKSAKTVNFTSVFNYKKKSKTTKKTKKIETLLRPSTKVTITVTKPGAIGNWFQAVTRAGKKAPKTSNGCLAVGSTSSHIKCPK